MTYNTNVKLPPLCQVIDLPYPATAQIVDVRVYAPRR